MPLHQCVPYCEDASSLHVHQSTCGLLPDRAATSVNAWANRRASRADRRKAAAPMRRVVREECRGVEAALHPRIHQIVLLFQSKRHREALPG
jgi:hypothetical protein